MANWRERAMERAENARDRLAELDLGDARKHLPDLDTKKARQHLPNLDTKKARKRLSEMDLEALRREDEATNNGFFGGFALGIAVGAILALIFAPMKGEQTRELVTERAVQLKEKATDLVAQVRGDDEMETTGMEPAI
ncbi:MAG: YtxH domain-containing protein [Chloroflexia bacterium]|nr:YtxH domain-containing protein [Chloroflexia bacterium]